MSKAGERGKTYALQKVFYTGKANVYLDLLKHFELEI